MYNISKKMMVGLLIASVSSAQVFGADTTTKKPEEKRERSQSPERAGKRQRAIERPMEMPGYAGNCETTKILFKEAENPMALKAWG